MSFKILKKLIRPLINLTREDIQQKIFNEFKKALNCNQKKYLEEIVLPKDFGKALPERVIELLLARLSYKPGAKVLDVAHANAMKCHRNMLLTLPEPRHLTGIDIAEPVYDITALYEHSYVGDITKTPFSENSFDLIWCISALEHFGMDNSGYTDNFLRENDMDVKAVSEMLRLLRIDGTLLITVPYGKFEDHGWLKNYDNKYWQNILDTASINGELHEFYFRHTFGEGWSCASKEELQYVGYFDQANSGCGALAAVIIKKLRKED